MEEEEISMQALVRGDSSTPFSQFAYYGLRGEHEAAMALLADDVKWTLMPSGQVLRGRAQAYQFLGAAFRAVTDRTPELINNVAMNEWGVFEYWNVGIVDEAIIQFAEETWGALPGHPEENVGKMFRVPVCFVYHLNSRGEIDLVREYMDIGSFVHNVSPRVS